MEGPPRAPSPLGHVETQGEDSHLGTRRWPLTRQQVCSTLTLTSSPQDGENKCCCPQPPAVVFCDSITDPNDWKSDCYLAVPGEGPAPGVLDGGPVLRLGNAERGLRRQGVRVCEQPVHLQQDVLGLHNLLELPSLPPRTHAQERRGWGCAGSRQLWVRRPFWGGASNRAKRSSRPPADTPGWSTGGRSRGRWDRVGGGAREGPGIEIFHGVDRGISVEETHEQNLGDTGVMSYHRRTSFVKDSD